MRIPLNQNGFFLVIGYTLCNTIIRLCKMTCLNLRRTKTVYAQVTFVTSLESSYDKSGGFLACT